MSFCLFFTVVNWGITVRLNLIVSSSASHFWSLTSQYFLNHLLLSHSLTSSLSSSLTHTHSSSLSLTLSLSRLLFLSLAYSFSLSLTLSYSLSPFLPLSFSPSHPLFLSFSLSHKHTQTLSHSLSPSIYLSLSIYLTLSLSFSSLIKEIRNYFNTIDCYARVKRLLAILKYFHSYFSRRNVMSFSFQFIVPTKRQKIFRIPWCWLNQQKSCQKIIIIF